MQGKGLDWVDVGEEQVKVSIRRPPRVTIGPAVACATWRLPIVDCRKFWYILSLFLTQNKRLPSSPSMFPESFP